MGFDLWRALGVSPMVGITVALGGLAAAVLLAIGMAIRGGRSPRLVSVRIDDGR